MIYSKVVTKKSADFGKTWSSMRVLTPISYSHGQVVYDAVRKRTLLHYQHHPSSNPCENSTMYQRFSVDDGETWSQERDITDILARCNPHAPSEMQVGSAGSKIQTSSGRIIFLGHAKSSPSVSSKGNAVACRWWTDDGGLTYNTSSPYPGNEASVAETAPDEIYMNGRGMSFSWIGNRSSFYSSDDGSTFSAPVACPIREDAKSGCSAGLVADPVKSKSDNSSAARLFLSEPAGPGRKDLVVHCSLDGGRTWPASFHVNGDLPAAYSAMRIVETSPGEHRILVVWEAGPNMNAKHSGTAWCTGGPK